MSAREAELQAELWRSIPLYEQIGLTVEAVRGGIYRCRVPLSRENGNHMNTVHAAVQWAAAEMLGGLVVYTLFSVEQRRAMFVAVRGVAIEFHRPARTAVTAEAVLGEPAAAEIVRLLSAGEDASFRLHAIVRDEAGETVATTEADYVVRPLRAARSSGPAA